MLECSSMPMYRALSLLATVWLCACFATKRAPTACPQTVPSSNRADRRSPLASDKATKHTTTLIRGATVWTAERGVLSSTDVLIRGGRIAEVGFDLDPRQAEVVIDAAGKHLTPGMIDPHSHLGVYASPALKAHSDGNEVGDPLAAGLRARDGLWPQDPGFSRALAAGVITAQILPGSANLIGGRSITIKLIPGAFAEQMRFPGAPTGLKMACGENPKRVYAKQGGPTTRMGNVARFACHATKSGGVS